VAGMLEKSVVTYTRPLDLSTLVLGNGSHTKPTVSGPEPGQLCVMEAVSWLTGEQWSDRPLCVSPSLAAGARAFNDYMPHELRQRLVPLIPYLINTAGDGLDDARAHLAAEWMISTYTPAFLELVDDLSDEAQRLRELSNDKDKCNWLITLHWSINNLARHVIQGSYGFSYFGGVYSKSLQVADDISIFCKRWIPGLFSDILVIAAHIAETMRDKGAEDVLQLLEPKMNESVFDLFVDMVHLKAE
jgi:hypothetical protein